ncbi:DinB family protein [Wukongibacter sp. M2B1]|uniref:DinB family protein n=1 Tax=Wukongibacter sp. M2B1 TaxID=3088895 RepID=UPI003D7B7641
MENTKKVWNENHKILRNLLKKELTFKKAIDLFMYQHAQIHDSDISGIKCVTFEDELWEGTDEITFRKGQNKKGRTIAYGMWHSARIEDIAMNLLVADEEQVIDKDNWLKRMNSSIYDTGNALNSDGILEFSGTIDMQALRGYRKAVGKKTRKIVNSLVYGDLKRKALESGLEKAIELGAVAKDENALWLIDFWRKKTVSGILLMQATRHHLVHINESMEAKRRGLRVNR